MKKVVIDTNIIFSALISSNRNLRDILTLENYEFLAPQYLFIELFKHKERLVAKAKSDADEIYEMLHSLLQHIHFVSEATISVTNFVNAYYLCKDFDPNDMLFIALCLELDAELWTKDEILKNGLQKGGFHNFFNPIAQ